MRLGRILLLLVLVAIAGLAAIAWRSTLPEQAPPSRADFPPARIALGATLAAIGNCVTCHTAHDGAPFAGGQPLSTPFGVIYATNITPDADTGIGAWSPEAFHRAMREGVSRDGHHLYPAFPYDHFRLVTDDDLDALYAFLMTRDPVHATAPPNQLPFPLTFRALLAGWNLLFLPTTRWQPDPTHDPVWNRGAYLAEGLAHCGACHTPHNALGAEQRDRAYQGGDIEGWHAPALDASSLAPLPWSVNQIAAFLRTGVASEHGVAAGPMAPVAHNLWQAPESDVTAIAVYVASRMGAPAGPRVAEIRAIIDGARPAPVDESAPASGVSSGRPPSGAAIFAGACAVCHQDGWHMPMERMAPLALSTALAATNPGNAIRIILDGRTPVEGEVGPLMPGFRETLTDDQLASLLGWLRQGLAQQPAWPDLTDSIRKARVDREQP
jgi:mono/diheme cytochrome c family protein